MAARHPGKAALLYPAAALLATLFATLAFGGCAKATAAPVGSASFDPAPVITGTQVVDAGLRVRVATWNVEGLDLGGAAPASTTRSNVAKVLADAGTDIAAFEEVQYDDLEGLRQALNSAGSKMSYLTMSKESDGYNALAVASRFPVLDATEILPPSSTTWPRSIYKVRIDVGKGLTLYVCHLKSGSDTQSLAKRIAQAKALADWLRSGYPTAITTASIVVVGDMNTMSEGDRSGASSTLSFLELEDDTDSSNDFTSMTESLLDPVDSWTWEGTVSGAPTRSSLDHIILSPAARSRYIGGSLAIHRSNPSVSLDSASDHRPVTLDLSL